MADKSMIWGCIWCAAAGILLARCEKMNGPEPLLSTYKKDIMLLDAAQAPLAPAIPVSKVQKLIINDEGFAALFSQGTDTAPPEPVGVPMVSLKKIVFQ